MADVFCRLTSRSDADGTVRFLHGQDVVDAVARHGNGISFRLDRLDEDGLLFGRHSPENRIFVGDGDHFLFVEPFQRDIFFCVGNAHALGNFGNSDGVIARDHLYGDVVFLEPADGLCGVVADVVRNGNDGKRFKRGGEFISRDLPRRVRNEKDSQTRRGVLIDDLIDLFGYGGEYKFGGADGDRSDLRKGYGGKFALGREGKNGRCRKRGVVSEIVIKGDGSLVVVLQRVQAGTHDLVDGIIRRIGEKHAVLNFHAAVRDGSRLVEAEHVDARQPFQRIEVLYEGVVRHQADDAEGKRDTGEKQHA